MGSGEDLAREDNQLHLPAQVDFLRVTQGDITHTCGHSINQIGGEILICFPDMRTAEKCNIRTGIGRLHDRFTCRRASGRQGTALKVRARMNKKPLT
ncbi:hypothetical protein RRG08_015598 [Elysia crispata]|uniref:Uncharacterized protein n=1 Tax=Elysia crispata TaxID=231223 RepID=A0AAE0ZS26_9GAST|nr:hypothetical protein RRG08_015598 [Elysia crispata]